MPWEIKAGQIWEDNQGCKRTGAQRFVEVIRVNGHWIQIRNIVTGRETRAMYQRFNEKSDGYSFVSEREDERKKEEDKGHCDPSESGSVSGDASTP